MVNAYLLAFGGLLLVAGRLGDVFGRRPTFLARVALFGAASLVGAGAQAPWQLVTGRFLQGAGAALAGPTALAMVTRLFTREDGGPGHWGSGALSRWWVWVARRASWSPGR